MKKINHVYFDVGGVTLFDYSGTDKWIEMKRALGVSEKQDQVFDAVWKKHRNRICIDCDVDHIIPEFETALNTTFPYNYSMLTDFVNRFEKNTSIWPIIQLTKEKYTIGLLTNMYPRILDAIKAKKLIPSISWDAVADSSVVGFQKPDDRMYQIAEKMAGSTPESILFIDNSLEHIQAAKRRGWEVILYDPSNPESSNTEIVETLELEI